MSILSDQVEPLYYICTRQAMMCAVCAYVCMRVCQRGKGRGEEENTKTLSESDTCILLLHRYRL